MVMVRIGRLSFLDSSRNHKRRRSAYLDGAPKAVGGLQVEGPAELQEHLPRLLPERRVLGAELAPHQVHLRRLRFVCLCVVCVVCAYFENCIYMCVCGCMCVGVWL